jgi:polar amino acid transport system substrate-binding protein
MSTLQELPLKLPRAWTKSPAAVATVILCGCQLPTDPKGTYDRVQQGHLRVGVSERPPWTTAADERPGVEQRLLSLYAQAHGLQVEWRVGSESALIDALDHGHVDVLIGGFTEDSPWADYAGATQPYIRHRDKRNVMLVRQGENRWLLELDRFLQAHRGTAATLLQQAERQ